MVLLEKTLESPLDCKEMKPVSPKGNQSLKFIRRTDAEAETEDSGSRPAQVHPGPGHKIPSAPHPKPAGEAGLEAWLF